MPKPETLRIYDRGVLNFDHDSLRLVVTVHINGGPDVRIFTNGPADIFWVDDPGLPVITCHNTIRQAFNHAAECAGWG